MKKQRWCCCYTTIIESAGEALEFTITRFSKEHYQAVVKEGYLVGASEFHWYGGLHFWLLTTASGSLKFRSLRQAQRACRVFGDEFLGGRQVPTSVAAAAQQAKYQRAVGTIALA